MSSNSKTLRPVIITHKGETLKGFFHRFVYSYCSYQSVTQALIELDDGRLRYFDPYFVRFVDRSGNPSKKIKQKEKITKDDSEVN